MPNGPYLSVQRFLGGAVEVTRGTPVVPAFYIPIDPNPALDPNLLNAEDKSLRGSPVEVYDDVPLVRHDQYQFKGNVFCDTFPNLVAGLLGGVDTVTGTAAPYTHSLPLLNAYTAGSQPPSFTLTDVDLLDPSGTQAAKQLAGAQQDALDVTFNATGALTYSSTWIANPYTEVSLAVPTFTSEVFVPAYNGTISIAGTQSFVVTDGSLSLKRSTAPIFTIGQQGPFRNFAGPISVTGKFTILALAGDQTMFNGLNYEKQVVILTFTDPVSSHSVQFQMSRVQFLKPAVKSDKPYITVETEFTAEANTSDAASGYAPITFTAVNAKSSPYPA